jgi:hypothetical protein
VIGKKAYDAKADIFSVGCIFLELARGFSLGVCGFPCVFLTGLSAAALVSSLIRREQPTSPRRYYTSV